jgi:MOSC domain-containing protein YiiM
MSMKLLSIQVGEPQVKTHNGKEISTSIFKEPVQGPVMVFETNIEGDGQADLTVHGGKDKAVYAFSADAYPPWNEHYRQTFPWGALGENLTFDELDETKIGIGDVYALGECELEVSEPRFPCAKLAVRMNDPKSLKFFNDQARPGVYFRVLKPGKIDRGQVLTKLSQEKEFVSVVDLFDLKVVGPDEEILEKCLKLESLNEAWRLRVQKMLAGIS